MENLFLKKVLFLLSILIYGGANGQDPEISIHNVTSGDTDTSYVESFTDLITTRIYLSRKYNRVDLTQDENDNEINYEPNSSQNLGIGATYRAFTLNIGIGFKFLNPDEGKGKTRYLDLQSHIYTRKLTLDFYGQFYTGYFLNNTFDVLPDFESYYVRPDIYSRLIGLSGTWVFNNRKFSYRAALTQNEWQKKSAGSFLAGLDIFTGGVRGDSSLIPSIMASSELFDSLEIGKFSFFKFGPTGGYAYSLVIKKRFFATISATLNLSYTSLKEVTELGDHRKSSVDPNIAYRLIFGYNSPKWFLGISFVNSAISIQGGPENTFYAMNSGNVRVNLCRRFQLSQKAKNYLKKIEKPILPSEE